jgi:hypothetical protein
MGSDGHMEPDCLLLEEEVLHQPESNHTGLEALNRDNGAAAVGTTSGRDTNITTNSEASTNLLLLLTPNGNFGRTKG